MLEAPNKYKGKQAIINSGRILLNSKNDSILLFSKKSIAFSSNDSVNIDTKNFIVNSEKTYIGLKSINEKEPLMLGGTTNQLLLDLNKNLLKYINLIKLGSGTPQSLLSASGYLESKINNIISKLENKTILSKSNFTA